METTTSKKPSGIKSKWRVDPAHSEIQFRVRHMMISNVTGHFNQFNATVESDGEDFASAKVHFTADLESITTNNEQRDSHLKSAEFFDIKNHPQLRFESLYMVKLKEDKYLMEGKLTIRDVTKPIELNVDFGGITEDPYGNTRAGFSISGKINRKDYGMTFHSVTEAGKVVVSEEVAILCNVEFIKEKAGELSS